MRWRWIILLLVLPGCRSPVVDEVHTTLPLWQQLHITREIEEMDQDPAALIPADVNWYVHLKDLRSWFSEENNDPMAEHLWSVISEFQPPGLWRRGIAYLGIDDRGLAETYFGQSVAVASRKIGDETGVVVLSRADRDALEVLPTALGLSPYGLSDQIGPFRIWSGWEDDREYLFAVGHRWLLITEADYADHLRDMLVSVAAGGRALNGNEDFNALRKQLPEIYDGLVLVKDDAHKKVDHHALTIVRQDQAVDVRYAAQASRLDAFLEQVQQSEAVNFSPLPRSVVSAVSIHVLQKELPGSSLLNMLLFPANFRGSIRPHIAPPIFLMMGRLERDRVSPDPGVAVPVLGIAVRMTDPAVSLNLDRLVRGLHFLLTASRLDLAKGFFGVRQVQREGLVYHIADLGPIIQDQLKDGQFRRIASLPSSAGLTRIAFGPVGEYYIICSQEAFLHDWDAAMKQPDQRLDRVENFEDFAFAAPPNILASAITRAPELSALLKEVAAYWREAGRQQKADDPPADESPSKSQDRAEPSDRSKAEQAAAQPDPIEQPLRWIADGLRHRQSFSLQLWRDDEKILHGRMRILPHEDRSRIRRHKPHPD